MKPTKATNRRNFLLAAGLGGAGVVAAVATTKGAKPGAKELPAVDKPTGYQASEHVLKYYKTTEV